VQIDFDHVQDAVMLISLNAHASTTPLFDSPIVATIHSADAHPSESPIIAAALGVPLTTSVGNVATVGCIARRNGEWRLYCAPSQWQGDYAMGRPFVGHFTTGPDLEAQWKGKPEYDD